QSLYMMVDKVEAPDLATLVFHLKFATGAFLPALADPFTWIYKKEILDRDPRWYEKNVLGSGPFKFVSYEAGTAVKSVPKPDYYHRGLPYLDGFTGLYAPKSGSMRSAAIGRRSISAICRPPHATSSSARSATRSPCRRVISTAVTWSPQTTRKSP